MIDSVDDRSRSRPDVITHTVSVDPISVPDHDPPLNLFPINDQDDALD